jgi:hypothetical protein
MQASARCFWSYTPSWKKARDNFVQPYVVPAIARQEWLSRQREEAEYRYQRYFKAVRWSNYLFGVISALMMLVLEQWAFAKQPEWDYDNDVERAFMGMWQLIGMVFLPISGIMAVLSFCSAFYLKELKNQKFIFCVSILQCLFFPFGLILGVVTIRLLFRLFMREIFDSKLNRIDR